MIGPSIEQAIYQRSKQFRAKIEQKARQLQPKIEAKPVSKPCEIPQFLEAEPDAIEQWVERQKKAYEPWFSIERPKSGEVLIAEIQRATCREYNVSRSDLVSHWRTADIVRARMVAAFLCKKHTSKSLPYIGRAFGGRDHTTILHSVRKIEDLLKSDGELDGRLRNIEKSLGVA